MFKTIPLICLFYGLLVPQFLKGQCQSTQEPQAWWSEFNSTDLSSKTCSEKYFSGAEAIEIGRVSNQLTFTRIKKKGNVFRVTDDPEYVFVEEGTEVLVVGARGDERCLRTPDDHYAWAKESDFEIIQREDESSESWSGEWVREKSSINISQSNEGLFEIVGKDFWYSRNEPFTNNDFTHQAKEVECTLYSGRPGTRKCRITYRQIGSHLVVRENGRCGGRNVRISGVYNRQ